MWPKMVSKRWSLEVDAAMCSMYPASFLLAEVDVASLLAEVLVGIHMVAIVEEAVASWAATLEEFSILEAKILFEPEDVAIVEGAVRAVDIPAEETLQEGLAEEILLVDLVDTLVANGLIQRIVAVYPQEA